jgi:MoxR-like ATPase
MFVGRLGQLGTLESALLQTRAGQPKSFMLLGERGIGKTSLLQYFKYVAQGHIDINGDKLNFLVIELDIDDSSTDIGLIRRINLGLNRELAKTEKAKSFLAGGWDFLTRIEALGVSLKEKAPASDPETLHDEFAHSLALTVNRITETDAAPLFGARYDGVVLLIDEADNAPKSLRLGSLLKLLVERVQRHGCTKFMIGLAGMPTLREVLREGHASSLRIFDDLPLDTLTKSEVDSVIDRALSKANEQNAESVSIDEPARIALFAYSEGYPHFIQQFGYSAFAADTDNIITKADVGRGAFGPQGAMEKIGDRYYRGDFYKKIQQDSYRQVLRIMAANSNTWVSKKDISTKFRGKKETLNNALHALRERKIILAKEGQIGTYRLQHRGFALWILLYASDPNEVMPQLALTSRTDEAQTP